MISEEWISQKEFAQLIGVHLRTMTNLRDAGLEKYCRVGSRRVEVQMPEGFRWYVAYRERIVQDTGKAPAEGSADQRYELARARKAEIELEQLEGTMVKLADVELWAGELFARARSRLDALPTRIATGVTAETVPERRAQAQLLVDEVLAELHPGDRPLLADRLDEEDDE